MDNKPPKCACVPSGRCHSHTLIGCPHNHYFNENSAWTCDLTNTMRSYPPTAYSQTGTDDVSQFVSPNVSQTAGTCYLDNFILFNRYKRLHNVN